ncbi:hypothetical protein CRE_28569 [Caenorhabditis remanei]|uniref:Uncharacterized protein n=1 Tax=Caenorhabditis remanei TaxID=31234 RepID=E3LN43_CAERE|nr:hypothetical protein CRE_28569 [Caenorhabditis remanei]
MISSCSSVILIDQEPIPMDPTPSTENDSRIQTRRSLCSAYKLSNTVSVPKQHDQLHSDPTDQLTQLLKQCITQTKDLVEISGSYQKNLKEPNASFEKPLSFKNLFDELNQGFYQSPTFETLSSPQKVDNETEESTLQQIPRGSVTSKYCPIKRIHVFVVSVLDGSDMVFHYSPVHQNLIRHYCLICEDSGNGVVETLQKEVTEEEEESYKFYPLFRILYCSHINLFVVHFGFHGVILQCAFNEFTREFEAYDCQECPETVKEEHLKPIYVEYCEAISDTIIHMANTMTGFIEQYVYESKTMEFKQVFHPENAFDGAKLSRDTVLYVVPELNGRETKIMRDLEGKVTKHTYIPEDQDHVQLPQRTVRTIGVQRAQKDVDVLKTKEESIWREEDLKIHDFYQSALPLATSTPLKSVKTQEDLE